MSERSGASEAPRRRRLLRTTALFLAAAGMAACSHKSNDGSTPSSAPSQSVTTTELAAPTNDIHGNSNPNLNYPAYGDFRDYPVVYCENYPSDRVSVFISDLGPPHSTIIQTLVGEVVADESNPGSSYFTNGWSLHYRPGSRTVDAHPLSGLSTAKTGELEAAFEPAPSYKTSPGDVIVQDLPGIKLEIEAVAKLPEDSVTNLYNLDPNQPGIIATVSCEDRTQDKTAA